MCKTVTCLLLLSLLLLTTAEEAVTCSGDEVTVDPVSQGRVDKILAQILKFPRLIGRIRKNIKEDKDHWIRKLLRNAGRDVRDESDTEDLGDATEPIPMGLVSVMGKIIGKTRTVVGYLWHYGFIPKILNKFQKEADDFDGNIPACGVTNAVIAFQVFNQITPANGVLTKETTDKMAEDRCGNPDVKCDTRKCLTADRLHNKKDNDVMRRKRYATQRKSWRISRGGAYYLGYYFENYYNSAAEGKEGHDQNMGREVVRSQVERGFQEWTKYAGLNFIEVRNPKNAHIKIRFGSGLHGEKSENKAFDGEYGVLAHMYYPRNGQMHFDEAENYTSSELNRGINLLMVAAHEMGHGLGLRHSETDRVALMAPYYKAYREEALGWDDINGIRHIYGKGQGSVTPLQGDVYIPPVKYAEIESVSASDPVICAQLGSCEPEGESEEEGEEAVEEEAEDTATRECIEYFELAFSDPTGHFVYLFYNTDKYLRLTAGRKSMPEVEGREDFVHRLVAEEFPGLAGPYEAAVTYKETTYFFRGGAVTSWDWSQGAVGALRDVPLSETGFKGLPGALDAVGSYHDQLIFFSGDRYYVYDAVHEVIEEPAGAPTEGGDGEEVAASFDSYYNGYLYTVQGEGRSNNIYNLLNAKKVLVHGMSFEEALLEAYTWVEMDQDTMFGWPRQLDFCVGIPDANEV